MTIRDFRNYILKALDRSETYNPGLANKSMISLTVSSAMKSAFKYFGLESEYVDLTIAEGYTTNALYFVPAPANKPVNDVYIHVLDVYFNNPRSLEIALSEDLENKINTDGTVYNKMVTVADNLSQIFYAFETAVLVQITEDEVVKHNAEIIAETLATEYGLTDDKLDAFARDRLDNNKTMSWYKETKIFLDFLYSINKELPFVVKQGAMELQYIWRHPYFNAVLYQIILNYSTRDLTELYKNKE